MLGVQVTSADGWDPAYATSSLSASTNRLTKATQVNAFFDCATREQRVLLTTSKSLLERNTCPRYSRYVDPAQQPQELIALFQEYGLHLSRDRFLTVCGKCGAEITKITHDDPRMTGKVSMFWAIASISLRSSESGFTLV